MKVLTKRGTGALSIEDKRLIVEKFKQGTSQATLAALYQRSPGCISKIIKKHRTHPDGMESGITGEKQRQRVLKLDKFLVDWMTTCRYKKFPVSGGMLQAKALEINEKFNLNPKFVASPGWLQKFKKRHGIRCLALMGEKASADLPAAEDFKNSFADLFREGNYDYGNVYNADESGLYWRVLPDKTLSFQDEKQADGSKLHKERLTIMVCANSTGCHKIPILGIGKSRSPRGFPKESGQLPTYYSHSAKAWMTQAIFVEWYETIFIPTVKEYQASQNRSGERVLLLLDNAPTHPKASTLEREDGQFRVVFLPPNVTSIQQPMDQNVIANLKARYRKHLLHTF